MFWCALVASQWQKFAYLARGRIEPSLGGPPRVVVVFLVATDLIVLLRAFEIINALSDDAGQRSNDNHNNPFNGRLSRVTRVSRYQKTFTHSHTVFVALMQHLLLTFSTFCGP